jgi:hypothetical protein
MRSEPRDPIASQESTGSTREPVGDTHTHTKTVCMRAPKRPLSFYVILGEITPSVEIAM